MKVIRKIAEPFKHVEIRELDENGSPINHYVISPGDDYTVTPGDNLVAEQQDIQDVCAELHTPEVIAAYQKHVAEQME